VLVYTAGAGRHNNKRRHDGRCKERESASADVERVFEG
jgi:hypothetical protein